MDKGYGKFMMPSDKNREDIEVPKTADMGEKFNNVKFNQMFNNTVYKDDDPTNNCAEDNELDAFFTGGIGCVELGGADIQDFSAACSDLVLSDYMKTHTTSCIINPMHVKPRQEFKDVDELMKHREDASFNINTSNKAYYDRIAQKEMLNERMEQECLKRLAEHEQQIQQQFETLNGLLVSSRPVRKFLTHRVP